ncbi:hypothetical protein ABPG74_014243 [Tetrahymena malaccensis]
MAAETENYKQMNSYHLNSQSKIYNQSPNNKSLIHYNSQLRDGSQSGYSDYYMPGSSRQAAMASIYKGIKNNDVSQILGKSSNNRSFLPSINQRGDDDNFDERTEVHKSLTEMRKHYDQTKTLANRKEKELKQLQEESEKLKEQEQFLKENNVDVIQNEKEMVKGCEESKNQMEETVLQRKSYQHMRNRLKKDIQHYEKQVIIYQNELKQLRQEQNAIGLRAHQTRQFNDQTSKMMDEVMKNVEQERKERESKLNQIKGKIQTRQELDRKREERMMQMMAIADHAMHDKDPQEKKWRQLLLVHKFVSTLLKQKMEREMKKFEVVESAFQKIKTATGVSESEEIITKFLSREQTYGELLATIAESETKIDNLKKKNEQYNQKLADLKQELVALEMQQKKGKQGFKEQELIKKLDAMDEKVQRSILMKQKLYQWCIRILTKHEQVNRPKGFNQSKRTNFYEQYPRNQIEQLFNKVCTIFHAELDKTKDEDIEHVLDQLNQTNVNDETQNEEFIRRNLRIKPSIKKQQSDNQQPSEDHSFNSEKDSRDSYHAKSSSFIESDTETTQIDEDAENDHIGNLRGELKREQELQVKKKRLEKEKAQQKSPQK